GRFLDLNPRIGRPNYYANVAGSNPARAVVEDYLGDGGTRPGERGGAPGANREAWADQELGVYSYLPWSLVRRYIPDPDLRRTVGRLRRTRGFVHPLAYPLDRSPKRWLFRQASTLNLVREFREHYPRPTATGF